jgi:26S proteasome regulatory subunit T1
MRMMLSRLFCRGKSTGSTGKSPSPWEISGLVEEYIHLPTTSLTLRNLLVLGDKKSVRDSASYLQKELPKRLARRVSALQTLPFIVGVNPWIKSVYYFRALITSYELYRNSFSTIQSFPEITSDELETEFTATLQALVQGHLDVTTTLAKGFGECGIAYMSKEDRTSFINGMINARIGIRVLAENHRETTRFLLY